MTTVAEKRRQFAALHSQPEAFIIPNPWDVGSARLLEGLGFKALATTSSGFAYALGKADGQPTLEEKLAHCRAIAAATSIPVSADFEDGFAREPGQVAKNVASLIETGVAGCSIEDFDRDAKSLFELPLAVERVAAAVEAAGRADVPFTLTARAEHLLRGGRDLEEVIGRLKAFESVGADVVYAPGITSLEDLKTVTRELNQPFNVLGVLIPGATLADFQAAGAKRVSIGGALTWAAAKPIIEFGEQMLNDGSFAWTAQMASGRRIHELMS
jgi:2-methylisocitrate lyase-like PEP mutase family enzyme